eukprot:TRINITY_DN112552_c0_g1_i1.p1 TRINITY_DN112552_c0_g1~~TRINITY_DN112552_c0_g1_i1.p1  ORF type:complete len:518 (+),score=87.19 TRINITY_DN112552_c0_g1_i1:42-1595(+)
MEPSPRRRPPPATISGFDCKDELDADDLFWMAAYTKGFAPADFQVKTISDFGGKGVTPGIQQKRWDSWNNTRNNHMNMVLAARRTLLQQEAQAAQIQLLREQHNRTGGTAATDAHTTTSSPTLAASLAVKRQFAEGHNSRAEDLAQIRELKKNQERQRVEQIYDNISMRNFLYYRDKEEKERLQKQTDKERRQKLEDERAKREQRRKNLLLEQDHQLHFLKLKTNHIDTVLAKRMEARSEQSEVLQQKTSAKQQAVEQNRIARERQVEDSLAKKIKQGNFVSSQAANKKEEMKQAKQEESMKRRDHATQVLQRSKEILQKRQEHWREQSQQEQQRREIGAKRTQELKRNAIEQRKKKEEERLEAVVARYNGNRQNAVAATSQRILEKEFNSQLQVAKNEEEKQLKTEELALARQNKVAVVQRLQREKEIQEQQKREAINGKYLKMFQNEQLKSLTQLEYSSRKQNSTVVPAPPPIPPPGGHKGRQHRRGSAATAPQGAAEEQSDAAQAEEAEQATAE